MAGGTAFLGNLTNLFSELGLTALARQSPSAVAITGGTISGLSSLTSNGNINASGNLSVNGSGSSIVAYDRNLSGNSAQFYRSAGTNYLTDGATTAMSWVGSAVTHPGTLTVTGTTALAAITASGTLTSTTGNAIQQTLNSGAIGTEAHPWVVNSGSGATYQYAQAGITGIYDSARGGAWSYTWGTSTFATTNISASGSIAGNTLSISSTASLSGPLTYTSTTSALFSAIGNRILIQNNNDGGVQAYLGQTFGAGWIGLHNASGSTVGSIPSGTSQTALLWSASGAVGSSAISVANASNGSFGTTPTFRNLLDDGAGNMSAAGEVCGSLGGYTYAQFRALYGSTSFLIRNDGSNVYFMLAAGAGTTWNGLRPIVIGVSNGFVTLGNGVSINGYGASASQVQAGTDNNTPLTSASLAAASTEQTIAYASSVTPNFALGFNANISLTGAVTFNNPTGLIPGRTYVLRLYMAAANCTAAWGSAYDFGAAGAPTITTTSGKHDLIYMYCITTSLLACTYAKSF